MTDLHTADPIRVIVEQAPSTAPEVWALIGVVVGAIIGACAQIVAAHLASKRSREDDSLAQRRSAYIDFIQSIDAQWAVLLEMQDSPTPEVQERYARASVVTSQSHVSLAIYAPIEVQRAAKAVQRCLSGHAEGTMLDDLSGAWHRLITLKPHQFFELKHAALEAIRKDLGYGGDVFRHPFEGTVQGTASS